MGKIFSGKHTLLGGGNIIIWIVTLLVPSLVFQSAHAAAPELQTPGPVIFLADNIDEKDQLGWCIDTLGRGWSDKLQTHSCKPRGGDVQFSYNEETRQIESVEFPGKCATLHEAAVAGASFDLLDCSPESAEQRFIYDAETLEFRPEGDHDLCIVAGAASKSAGPFMSRALELAACVSTDTILKQWVVKPGM